MHSMPVSQVMPHQPRREQRQQVIQAAREEGIFVVPEGGSTFYHNMTMIMDGHTGIEHNIPVAPVYKDILTLWGNSKTGYTPTLVVNYAGMSGEYYWYQNTNVWENEKLLATIYSAMRLRETKLEVVADAPPVVYCTDPVGAATFLRTFLLYTISPVLSL